ncbi:MAG: Gfo/Idh/MocA family oxidoreductase [Rhodospirillaceae bacterium]|nr:Gfo/Idh/MocA family oxidoreductase [Rhodospirillaceae bacterium]
MTRWKTALFGFGKIGSGLADDPLMALHYPYATHAQVLRDHSAFDWVAVVDPTETARTSALKLWHVPETAASAHALRSANEIEVAIIATPPDSRPNIIGSLPNLRAVLVEKPLAATPAAAENFLSLCEARGISVNVSLPRRHDYSLRELAEGRLVQQIGTPMAAFAVYGNGLANNGTHMIDLIHLLLGDICSVQAIAGSTPFVEGPISGDINLPFTLTLQSGIAAMVHPVKFSCYRENSLDIWGERGRLQILREGLSFLYTPATKSRTTTGANEIAHDQASLTTSSIGCALYSVYDNLDCVLRGGQSHCPGHLALKTMRIVDAILRSADANGTVIPCDVA